MRASRKKFVGRPSKILVVDDEPDLERLVRQRMRREVRSGRFILEFARNGLEALECLESRGPIDLVLSDINMPRMDGLTLLQQIPSVDPDVRAVIVSAYGDMKNIRTAMNRGAFDFVTKPIDFKDLRITIDRTLRNLAVWRDALRSRDKLVALENELGLARRMQRSILPTAFPESRTHQLFANMHPAKGVAGDFFDVVELERGRVGLAIADVSGKGIPAALFMMSSRTLLKGAAIGGGTPGEVLGDVNIVLEGENAAMMFVTMLYAVFNPRTGEFSYSSGGHESPLVVRTDGTVDELPRTGGVALGVLPSAQFVSETVELAPGESILLYTDGVTDALNPHGERFGLGRLSRIFAGSPPSSAREATENVFRAVREFAGAAEQFDDLTCLVLRRRASLP